MKIAHTARNYRAPAARSGEKSFQIIMDESDLWITCLEDTPPDLPERIRAKLGALRATLKAWMRLQPEFGPSLLPLDVPEEAPTLIRRMAEAGRRFEVGPMAAVAGAVAEEIARAFAPESSEFIVENGGDIFMCSTRERTVALLPNPAEGTSIGLRLKPELFPLAVCSSSATIGHSLSFGRGELVTVLAGDACLADAAATSLCNRLKGKGDLQRIIKMAENDPDIIGLFAQCGQELGVWGEVELALIGG